MWMWMRLRSLLQHAMRLGTVSGDPDLGERRIYPLDDAEYDWILSNPPIMRIFLPRLFIEKGFNRLRIGAGC
jgi:hypothetical protein